MRLSFYSGLAIAVLAADTAQANKLDDFNDEALLAQIEESDNKDWSLAQNASEGDASLSTGADTEAGNDSEAWATASSGSEGESESDAELDSEGSADSASDSGSDLDSDSDADADDDSLAQTGADA